MLVFQLKRVSWRQISPSALCGVFRSLKRALDDLLECSDDQEGVSKGSAVEAVEIRDPTAT